MNDMLHLLDYLRWMQDGRKLQGIRYPPKVFLALFIMAKLCDENIVYGIADPVQLRSEYLIDTLGVKLKHKLLPQHSTYQHNLSYKVCANDFEIFFSEVWHN